MQKEKYSLGLDIGISSVGWGLLRLDEKGSPERIMDAGVKIFSPGEVAKTGESKNLERRKFRGSRRVTRRRSFRVDRVRHLLNLNGYLADQIIEGKVSNVNQILTDLYSDLLQQYYQNHCTTPYELKVQALDRKLTKEELCIILVHYAKHRGYKSNREDDNVISEIGRVKSNIAINELLMEQNHYRIVSEMFLQDERFQGRIRNSSDEYKMCVTREMYLDEINQVLDAQINYGLITESFKKDYLEIWEGQRHYSKGPGGDSKYGGDLIQRMTGTCKFDGNPRAPKFAPSSELFVALTNLVNFRYKDGRSGNYQSLTGEQIATIIELAKTQDTVTYSKVFKMLDVKVGIVKGLSLTTRERIAAVKSFCKKAGVERFSYVELDEEQRQLYDLIRFEQINKRNFIQFKAYSVIRKEFMCQLGSLEWDKVRDDYVLLDTIVKILTDYKLDEDVKEAIHNENINELYTDVILALPNFKDHMKLSSSLIRQLNPIMMLGISYDQAMAELNYVHYDVTGDVEKRDLLIPINQDQEIRNQRVIRSLAQARGIINSLIKKYGMPERINIETARELAKSMDERREIAKKRDTNKENNDRIKARLVELGLFSSIDRVTSTDVLKYKLWLEQNERCAYSLEVIPLHQLYDRNQVQIDHILPYSRTFDDTYFNKTLVLTKYNQEKRNMTPYEWFGNTERWIKFKAFIVNLDIPEKKRDNYLLQNLTPEIERDFRNQNLNDTKYISKYLVSYIKANLNVKKVGSPSGAIIGKLRSYWHLNGLTHSLQSETYYLNGSNDAKKNRDNHLHHAADALVIAATNDALIRRISQYEQYRKYIDYQPLSSLIQYIQNYDDQFDIHKYWDENGKEAITSLREYAKQIRDKQYFRNHKGKTIVTFAPEPYQGFSEELKVRVYEQNEFVMKDRLNEFHYTKVELENATPIIPKFAKLKIGGKLHEDTCYSIRKDKDNGKLSKVMRISVADSKFNQKKLECILEKDGGSKDVYAAVKDWLGNHSDGMQAFKANSGYPVNPKTGNMIKKVKIESNYEGKGHIIGNKLVEKSNILQVNVYRSKQSDDEQLYFAGFDALDLIQMKGKRNKAGKMVVEPKNIEIDLWWASENNHKIYQRSEVDEQFELYLSLRKNQLVEIELKDGNNGKGYIVGFTSGTLEIQSVLGDGYDLVGKNGLFSSQKERYRLVVSKIQSIRKININNLGKIENGLPTSICKAK